MASPKISTAELLQQNKVWCTFEADKHKYK